MIFYYRAKDRQGQTVTGECDAETNSAARQKLRQQGLFVMSIETGQATTRVIRKHYHRSFSKVKKIDLVMSLSQLTIMCQSGVDLAEALRNIAEQCPRPVLRQVLLQVYQNVSQGQTMSAAMSQHPEVFDHSFVAGIAAGEHSGTIVSVLERLTQLLRADLRLRSTIWSMLTYPLVLLAVTSLVILAMLFFVLPQFAKVFADLDRPTPPLTTFLLSIGSVLGDHYQLVMAGVVALVIGLQLARKTSFYRRIVDYTCLHLAVVRNASRALIAGRIFRLLGTMLSSGVTLVEGVRLCRHAVQNYLFQDLFGQLERDILHGEGMGKPLLAANFLPIGAAHMIATAERTGKLGSVLQTVGEYYEDEGERSLRDVIKVLEPMIIVTLGLVVGVVVLSIVLPLLDISTMSQ